MTATEGGLRDYAQNEVGERVAKFAEECHAAGLVCTHDPEGGCTIVRARVRVKDRWCEADIMVPWLMIAMARIRLAEHIADELHAQIRRSLLVPIGKAPGSANLAVQIARIVHEYATSRAGAETSPATHDTGAGIVAVKIIAIVAEHLVSPIP